MKRFLLFFVLMIFPAVSHGDIASTTYVDNSMPGAATRDAAGIAPLGTIPSGATGAGTATIWIE